MTREDREKILREIKEKVIEGKSQKDGDYLWSNLYNSAIMVSGVLDTVKLAEKVGNVEWEKKTCSDQIFTLIHKILTED